MLNCTFNDKKVLIWDSVWISLKTLLKTKLKPKDAEQSKWILNNGIKGGKNWFGEEFYKMWLLKHMCLELEGSALVLKSF